MIKAAQITPSLFNRDAYGAPPIFAADFPDHLRDYRNRKTSQPIFFCGDALHVLESLPDASVDFVMTSPPYWNKRQYSEGGIGLESTFDGYINNLLAITHQLRRLLKPTGSFWLNVGDSYVQKQLLSIPWRIAIRLCDDQHWILRNTVIWNKVKGSPDNTTDKLRNLYEPVFHFVKCTTYYFDADAIRSNPRKARIVNGSVVSATGVHGVRYRRQIELSTDLTEAEKHNAFIALAQTLQQVQEGRLGDFRMIIRRQQRTTHSDSELLSGRAKELRDKGFYFLKYHPKGSKPSDVWDIIPEDTQNRAEHFAPYPEDLCRIPLLATCPQDGLALDPFCGTGTTNVAAHRLSRKSIGIDIALSYLKTCYERSRSV